MLNIVNKFFGGLGSKNLKTYDKIVKKINDFETEISKLDDQELERLRKNVPLQESGRNEQSLNVITT